MVNINNINIPIVLKNKKNKLTKTTDSNNSLLQEAKELIYSLKREYGLLKNEHFEEKKKKQLYIENLEEKVKELKISLESLKEFQKTKPVSIPEIPEPISDADIDNINGPFPYSKSPDFSHKPTEKETICKHNDAWNEATVGEPKNKTIYMDFGDKEIKYDMTLYDVAADNNCFYHAISTGILGSASNWKDISNKSIDLCKVLTDYYVKYKIEKGDSAKLDHVFFRWITIQEIKKTEVNDVIFNHFYDDERSMSKEGELIWNSESYEKLSKTEKNNVKNNFIEQVNMICNKKGWGGFLETILLYRALGGLVTPTICTEHNDIYHIRSYGSVNLSHFSRNEDISFLFLAHGDNHYKIFEREGKSIVKSSDLN